jgi:phage head maturation protease
MSIERRDYDLEGLEIRETEGATTIRGMAIPFNRNSADLGGFIERIEPGAVKSVDDTDVVMLWQHDSADPITRQSSGLKLEVRKSGLWFEAPASDFTDRQLDLLQRGVVKCPTTSAPQSTRIAAPRGRSRGWRTSRQSSGPI